LSNKRGNTTTFHTRIPTLTDAELQKYLQHPEKYKREAIEAAAAELRNRGQEVSDLEWNALRERRTQRDDAAGPGFLHDGTAPRLGRIHFITGAILAAGFAGAALIYRLATSAETAGIDLESEDSKRYLRELEAVGGKANVLASEMRHWLGGLFQGRTLAFTVAWSALLLAVAFWFIATQGHGRKR